VWTTSLLPAIRLYAIRLYAIRLYGRPTATRRFVPPVAAQARAACTAVHGAASGAMHLAGCGFKSPAMVQDREAYK
jgi:hypothetical protein